MEEIDILKIDNRGRIAIPQSIRDMFGLLGKKDPRLIVNLVKDKKELILKHQDSIMEHSESDKQRIPSESISNVKSKILKLDKGGRICLTQSLREHLELEKYSYIMAISNPLKKITILKKAMILQIKNKDKHEWRVISPIPDDLNAFEKELKEKNEIESLQFILTDPYYENKKVKERKLAHLLSD